MNYFLAFLKSATWIFIGVIFGAATFISVFTSSLIFKNQTVNLSSFFLSDRNDEFGYKYVMFLCIFLMAGASADHFCSINKSFTNRTYPLIVTFVGLIFLFYLFNPNVIYKPAESVEKNLTILYSLSAFVFCVFIKGTLFYEELKFEKLKLNFNK